MTDTSTACGGTYQAGQQVTISGGGFTPGALVQAYVTSPGLGATDDQLVAQLTADAAGNITTTVRVPLGATGFTQPGATAGTAFIDALGPGAANAHVDDATMIGLAPATSACGTVEPYQFNGFGLPILNRPWINFIIPGSIVPVSFNLPGSNATLTSILAPNYPQVAAVSCTAPAQLTSGTPTTPTPTDLGVHSDNYLYLWHTNATSHGCQELIVKLVDGTYHRAISSSASAEPTPNRHGRSPLAGQPGAACEQQPGQRWLAQRR